ncbi:MAG: hypothetical protein ABR530_08430 [Pyrinomonadaceae bacterium]
MKKMTCRSIICVLCAAFLSLSVSAASAAELTQAQAISRVRSILRNNTAGCRINKVNAVTAARVRAGWRVTANIIMSASGRRLSEKAIWIVSERNGASPQDQLTAEIQNGC